MQLYRNARMKQSFPSFCIVSLLAVCLAAAEVPPTFNPKPIVGDYSLPIPGGGEIVFRPVSLGVPFGSFAIREFIAGDRGGGGFRENPTRVAIGGGIPIQTVKGTEAGFYIAKYEITEAQYDAVMKGTLSPSANPVLTPKVNITYSEIEAFLEHYNQWLIKNAPDRLQHAGDCRSWVRLPTEAEWEFAARGGSAVTQDVFDQRNPYPSQNTLKHEWFSGSRSSFDKLKKIGLLDPNPLGIFDMLGNVSEAGSNPYQIEYVQGQVGGRVVRGGNFRSEESEIRSSHREEWPMLTGKGELPRSESIGFRIAIGAPAIQSVAQARVLEKDWSSYRNSRPVTGSGQAAIASVSEQSALEIKDIDRVLGEIDALIKKKSTDKIQGKIQLLRSSYKNIESHLNRAESLLAESGTLQASLSATQIVRETKKFAIIKESLSSNDEAERKDAEETAKAIALNLQDAQNRYEYSFKILSKADAAACASEFRKHIDRLKKEEEGGSKSEQREATEKAEAHLREYRESGRMNTRAWIQELSGLSEKEMEKIEPPKKQNQTQEIMSGFFKKILSK